ncbi:glycosyltransferase involved in cell wall biosynthesis [Microbacterium terrae]|uniref:Spore coat protein SA n=2 Tax=Microbacterium terrae TaxID=69369 RepID=A0A0M2HDC9_9MICO|nr:glycosyltransferase family 4 protein [Microbacterium terrae]KJL42704.1 Spore coat protein SA [Microbacterium terrae]MBP1078583.1 glycosyltransferase involved in cell wall biosynthesis [Microbacterium terrae]GLJ97983.1 hypothetical protein GCM10017594_11800 [Microbacterium terrae]
MRRVIHALTPGDHFSPRTGSAIPTVVHGIASASADDPDYAHSVLVESSTYRPRYTSAASIEYAGRGYPASWERAVDLGLSRLGLPRVRSRRSYGPLVDAIDAREPGIVIAHNAPVLPEMIAATPHAVIYYAHNDLPRGMSRHEATRMLGAAVAVVVVSDDLADRIAARVSPSVSQQIRVVENGVDTDAFQPPVRTESGDRTRVMFVGRVVAEKGPDVLLRAVAALGRDDVDVVIVGSQGFDPKAALSPYEQELRALADAVPGTVSFRPFVDRAALPGQLQSADVFVAPSRWAEPSGLTIGEAMATGLPVIASDIGGIPSVIGDAGLLVEPGDAPALAAGLGALLDDDSRRAALGARARERAQARSWAHTWTQLRGVLDESAD